MARHLTGTALRLWLLCALMTLVAATAGLSLYRGALACPSHDETGAQDKDRHPEPYGCSGWAAPGKADLPSLAIVLPIAMLVSGMAALILDRRIVRPLGLIALAAARVSGGDRTVRVPRGRASGDLGMLIDGFNGMAAALDAHDRRQRRLTADLAHALRTPLTILNGRLHALEDGIIDPATGEAERLLRQVEQLMRVVDDFGTPNRAGSERRDMPPS